jgi:hypothetical protein
VSRTRRGGPVPVVLAVTLGAFFAVRLPILLFEPDWGTTEMDQFGLFAAHLISGLLGPPADYLPQPHQGCTFVFGLGCAPFVALGGPEVGSLRLCSLALHAAIALVFTGLSARIAGWRGAAAAGALFVLAPPMLAHYAQKGSTNHDDCDLFVGLALLLLVSGGARGASREALARAAGAGVLVGVAAGYMLDGGMRGLVVLGLAVLLTGQGRAARAAAMGGGLLASLVTFLSLGVSDGEDGVVRKAFSRSTLWAEDRSGIEPAAPLLERVVQLVDFALPTGFRVSGPDLWGTVPLSEGVLLYAYPALMAALALLGLLALRLGDREPGAPPREASRLLWWACVLVPAVQCVAVLFAGLEVEVDYIAPIWPYLVVLAACALAPSERLRVPRLAATSLALSAALLLCFEGMQWKLLAFYGGPSTDEEDTFLQSRFAGALRAARPERHAFGPRLVEARGAEGLRALVDSRPLESPALLRMLGHAAAFALTEAACGPEREPPRRLGADLDPAARALFFEGLGEQVAQSPEPCPRLQGGPGAAGWDGALGQALRVAAGSDWDALVQGVAFGLLDLRDGRFGGLERGFPWGPARRAMCVGAGQWAFVTMRPVELMEWLDPARACAEEELAAGWGLAAGRDRVPTADGAPTPAYRWWWPDASPAASMAFDCAWRAERAVVESITAGAPWNPAEDCLPPPESPATVVPTP